MRDAVVLVAISITFCLAFLVEPDSSLREAQRICAEQPVQNFESMAACSVGQAPGCSCVRTQNPWVIVYWLALLTSVGIAAALLLRAPASMGALLLIVAMASGGFFGFLFLSWRRLFEPEAWGYAPFVIALHTAIALVVYGAARLLWRGSAQKAARK
jgi:hypothetical protein